MIVTELLRNAGLLRKKMKAEAKAKAEAKPMRMTSFSVWNARCPVARSPQVKRCARHAPFK